MTKTIESYIAAYPEMDGILLLGTYCEAALPTIEKALSDHGKAGQVKVGRIDFDSTMGEYLQAGSFHVSYGGQQQIDPMMSAVVLVNKVIGTPIDEKGPTILITPYLELTSAQEATDFTNYFLGDTPVYTADEIKASMIKFYKPEIDHAYMDKLDCHLLHRGCGVAAQVTSISTLRGGVRPPRSATQPPGSAGSKVRFVDNEKNNYPNRRHPVAAHAGLRHLSGA